MIIYTSLTNGYDKLQELQADVSATNVGCEFICFSNDADLKGKSGVWQIRPIPFSCKDPARLSRFAKLNPHIVLPNCEESLYVDANVLLKEPLFSALAAARAATASVAMCPHPTRDCTYDEAQEAIRVFWPPPSAVIRQVKFLLSENYPRHAGLQQCNIIYRRHLCPNVVKFSEVWWRQFCEFSRRDQISVGYALKEAGITPTQLMTADEAKMLLVSHMPKTSPLWRKAYHCLARPYYMAQMRKLILNG